MYNNKERHSKTHMSQPVPLQAVVLTPAQLEAIVANEESFARYLASLTHEQIQALKAVLDTMSMEAVQKKAIGALLDLAYREALQNQKSLEARALEEKNILLCLELSKQLKELEKIQHSLSSQ